jgi:hypothetical protein
MDIFSMGVLHAKHDDDTTFAQLAGGPTDKLIFDY